MPAIQFSIFPFLHCFPATDHWFPFLSSNGQADPSYQSFDSSFFPRGYGKEASRQGKAPLFSGVDTLLPFFGQLGLQD